MKFQLLAVLLLVGLSFANPIPENEEYYEECEDIDAEFAQIPDLTGEIKMIEEDATVEPDCEEEDAVTDSNAAFVDVTALVKEFGEDATPTADCIEEEVTEEVEPAFVDVTALVKEFGEDVTPTADCIEEEVTEEVEAAFVEVTALVKAFGEDVTPTADCVEEDVTEESEPAFVDVTALVKEFAEEATPTADCIEEEVDEATVGNDYDAGHVLPDLIVKEEFEDVEPSDCVDTYEDSTIAAKADLEPALDVLSNAFAQIDQDEMLKLVGEDSLEDVEGDCEEYYE